MSLKISFIGDVSLTGSFKKKILKDEDNTVILSDEIIKIFSDSDYTICNLEGPVTSEKCVLSPNLNVKSPPNSISFLNSNHINVFGLANNHMFDASLKGFLDTKKELITNKVNYFGAGENINEASNITFLDKNGVCVAIIGVGHNVGRISDKKSYGIFSYTDEIILEKQIKKAKDIADWVLIFCHAGPEYNFFPTPSVRKRMKSIIKMGADIIIGHHPHVTQGIEHLKNNKLIVYSLGNFIFDLESTRNKKGHNIGLIASINFSKNEYKLSTNPVYIDTSKAFVSLASFKHAKELEFRSNFYDYHKQIVKDCLRCLFFNPILPKKNIIKIIIYFILYPIIIIYKTYHTSGYNREFVDVVIEYYKLNFFKRILKKDVFYKKN